MDNDYSQSKTGNSPYFSGTAAGLLGISYSEFDNRVGPRLRYCYPPSALSDDLFEMYSDYVIVSKQITERVILVTLEDMQFINYPVAIENEKYDRNTLTFSFGFVLRRAVNIEPYCTVLKKIATAFVNFELEYEYLHQESKQNKLPAFLSTVFHQLKERNEAFIDMQLGGNYLALKLYKAPVLPAYINDYDVPIFRRDHINMTLLPWDVSFPHLLPHIDGISHVRQIVREVGMDSETVKRSLMLLQFHDAIIISDVFKFSNVYKLQTEIAVSLMSDDALMEEMRIFAAPVGVQRAPSSSQAAAGASAQVSAQEAVAASAAATSNTVGASTTASGTAMDADCIPSREQVIQFLLQLQPSCTVRDILINNFAITSKNNEKTAQTNLPAMPLGKTAKLAKRQVKSSSTAVRLNLKNLNIPRLLAFANAKGLIKRVHEYPVYTYTDAEVTDHAKPPTDVTTPPLSVAGKTQVSGFLKLTKTKSLMRSSGHLPHSTPTTDSQHLYHSEQQQHHPYHLHLVTVADILHELDGSEHMDSLCCRYELTYSDIAAHPGVNLVYK